MTLIQERPVNEFVTDDFRTAAVFEKYGIDFCCRGDKSVAKACAEQGIKVEELLREIQETLTATTSAAPNFDAMDLDVLAAHIVETHHRYVREMSPSILKHTAKVASVHGANHPETIKIRDAFERIMAELVPHMHKEEMVLFPMIAQLAQAKRTSVALRNGMISGPISVMRAEHDGVGQELALIRELSNQFTLPEDACGTYRVTFQELAEFERDLHEHIYLENAILFPKALELARG